MASDDPTVPDPAMYAPFRPRMTRAVGRGVVVVLALATLALLYTSPGADGPWSDAGNTIAILALAAVCLLLVLRHAGVYAIVDPQGIRVRNLVVTTVLPWSAIEAVRFGSGEPWVNLDLADGGTLAVMAVQGADGAFARAEAQRLATLVAAHTRPS